MSKYNMFQSKDKFYIWQVEQDIIPFSQGIKAFGTICLINIMHNIQYISKTIGLISKCKKVTIEIKGHKRQRRRN